MKYIRYVVEGMYDTKLPLYLSNLMIHGMTDKSIRFLFELVAIVLSSIQPE